MTGVQTCALPISSTRTPKAVPQLRRAFPWSPVTSDVRHHVESPLQSWTFRSPDGRAEVDAEIFEEHHMGASTVRMRVRLPCEDIFPVFYSTGGDAFFTSDSEYLVIHDSKIVIAISVRSGVARHFAAPPVPLLFGLASKPRFIRGVEGDGQGIRVRCEDGFHKNQMVVNLSPNATDGWAVGLGTSQPGVLPSAYAPDVEHISRERRDA